MQYVQFFNQVNSNGLSGAYLLHGDEEYVKRSALSALYGILDPAAAEINQQECAPEADAIMVACETLPFFAERRIVVCRELPKGEDGLKIRDYLPNIPDTALLIFYVRGKADGSTALYKALNADGRAVLFDMLTPEEAMRWLQKQCVTLGVTMAPKAARLLIELVGVDLTLLKNEFTKAAGYAGAGAEITCDVISTAVTRNVEYRVFDMVDCFLSGKAGDGMRALDALLLGGESALGIAALLSSRFRLMLSARTLMDQGIDRNAAAKRMGGSDFAAKKAYDSAKRFSKPQLLYCITAFSNVAYMQISGAMRDREALELALLNSALCPR